jgi:hypothetical protein
MVNEEAKTSEQIEKSSGCSFQELNKDVKGIAPI